MMAKFRGGATSLVSSMCVRTAGLEEAVLRALAMPMTGIMCRGGMQPGSRTRELPLSILRSYAVLIFLALARNWNARRDHE
jgi:hypothetical protein